MCSLNGSKAITKTAIARLTAVSEEPETALMTAIYGWYRLRRSMCLGVPNRILLLSLIGAAVGGGACS